ncbi:ATP-binding protein [Sphingomonas sp. Leaf25]|uniref:ATP-binding protein n=1 Tax=Sphingomonas sp. Leaf25 TaxID=1735692 RepID=UPI0006FC3DB8|nr:ATP-binding protein [Sphingomonas sp. Leaf25]KQN00526.1 histidine kinase [Sphingomonas sp. Leaf25]
MQPARPLLPPRFLPPADGVGRNMLLLVQLRWLAVGGQLATILVVDGLLGIRLPLLPMAGVLAGLVLLNLLTLARRSRWSDTNLPIFAALVLDVSSLTAQLYLSGGARNPFVSLYLLQVVIGAILLPQWWNWALVAITSAAFALLAVVYRPLSLPPGYASDLSDAYLIGNWINFVLAATLLVAFVTRIAANLRDRDAKVAQLHNRAVEEEHIVRMGLLASGAAHELGTPLSSISVLLGDWKTEPAIRRSPRLAAEVDDMRGEIARCKDIVSGILFAAGEVTGEAPTRTTLRTFLTATLDRWRGSDPARATFEDRLGPDVPIVADRALAQAITNLLDNALEAGGRAIALVALRDGAMLRLSVRDDGPGFAAAILAALGKPYNTSKDRQGAGLGLYLATNVLRPLGGTIEAVNRESGGAETTLVLPIESLALEKPR